MYQIDTALWLRNNLLVGSTPLEEELTITEVVIGEKVQNKFYAAFFPVASMYFKLYLNWEGHGIRIP
jgi:hypothetical protein